VLNSRGHVVETISGGAITGPWDLTAVDEGNHTVLFVTSLLTGTVMANRHSVDGGTVVRIVLRTDGSNVPTVTSERTIASALSPTSDPNALIIGPTGVGLGADGVLDVADTLGSRIAAIPNALNRNSVLRNGGPTVTSGGDLMGPLGLVIAPGGDIVTADRGDGNIVKTTPNGNQITTQTLVPTGAGDPVGLAHTPNDNGLVFVNDPRSGTAATPLQSLH